MNARAGFLACRYQFLERFGSCFLEFVMQSVGIGVFAVKGRLGFGLQVARAFGGAVDRCLLSSCHPLDRALLRFTRDFARAMTCFRIQDWRPATW